MECANAAVQKVTLEHLDPNLTNALIVGIVIAKRAPKKFVDTKSSEGYRAVFNFTFRDSPRDFINVTYWGNVEKVYEMYHKFHLGDVVSIVKPAITVRKMSDKKEQFQPQVTSPFHLTLNDKSSLVKYEDEGFEKYTVLMHLPTKPPGFVLIRDIHKRQGPQEQEKYMDILGAVRYVGAIRDVTVRNGEILNVRNIILFDQTITELVITVWDKDLIDRAENWTPKETILFITDVKVSWSDFHNSVTGTITSRSIVTENPIGVEAKELKRFARDITFDSLSNLDRINGFIPDPKLIQNVMTIKQLQDACHHQLTDPKSDRHLTALIYAVVTHLDLDGLSKNIAKKCQRCKFRIKGATCENEKCPVFQGNEYLEVEVTFDIRLEIADHTGVLSNCRLSGLRAEEILQCSVQQFIEISDEDKTALKWKFLMEHCAIRIVGFALGGKKHTISIVGCELVSFLELAQKLPVF